MFSSDSVSFCGSDGLLYQSSVVRFCIVLTCFELFYIPRIYSFCFRGRNCRFAKLCSTEGHNMKIRICFASFLRTHSCRKQIKVYICACKDAKHWWFLSPLCVAVILVKYLGGLY